MKYITAILAPALLACGPAWADIAVQNEYYQEFTDSSGSGPSVTVGSGTNLGLVCTIVATDDGDVDTELPSSVTFNGDAMTQAVGNDPYQSAAASIWYLVNPDVTTAALTVNYTDANSDEARICYVLTGFAQTSSVANTDSNERDSLSCATELALSLTEVAGGFGAAGMTCDAGGGRTTTWTDFVEDQDHDPTGFHSSVASALLSATNAITPGATVDSGTGDQALVGAVFNPAASGLEFSSGPAITSGGFSLAKWPKAGEWINYEGTVFGPDGLFRRADRGEAILGRVLGDKYRSITTDYQFRQFEYTDLVAMPPGEGDCLEGFIPEGARVYVAMGEQPEPGDLVLVKFSERTRATFNYFAALGSPGVAYHPPDGYSVKIYYQMDGREILMNALQATTLADNKIVGVVRYADIDGTLAYMSPLDQGPPGRDGNGG